MRGLRARGLVLLYLAVLLAPAVVIWADVLADLDAAGTARVAAIATGVLVCLAVALIRHPVPDHGTGAADRTRPRTVEETASALRTRRLVAASIGWSITLLIPSLLDWGSVGTEFAAGAVIGAGVAWALYRHYLPHVPNLA